MDTAVTSAHAAPAARTAATAGRRRLLAGAGFAALFVGGIALAGLLGTGVYPSPLDSESAAAAYFADNRGVVLLQGILHTLAAVPLALFAASTATGRPAWRVGPRRSRRPPRA